MIVVVLISVATVGLILWLMVALGRIAFEVRLPRASAIARIGALPLRRFDPDPSPPHRQRDRGRPDPAPVYADDVERVVRERLYGSGPHSR